MDLGIEGIQHRRSANSARTTLIAGLIALVAAIALMLPTQAFAVDPEDTVGGVGSKWFSGTLLQQSGMNCSIIGGAYSETMVSAIAGYGGAPGGGIVHVGNNYYASLLVSIPGNPCGSGSTLVTTDLILPRDTSYDASRQIRCFGQPRNTNTFYEVTNESWTMPPGVGSGSGPYCPATVSPSQTGYGNIGVGYRLLASGQMFQLFVPIKSTQPLIGASANPADQITWVLNSSAAYTNIGSTSVWTNVLAGGGGTPYIYFARNPSVVPFWNNAAPTGQQNQVEWFANLYSAGLAGTFCWELHSGASAAGPIQFTCTSPIISWSSGVNGTSDLWQVFGSGGSLGPNGGYVPPLVFDPGETATIRWTFAPSGGGFYYKDITFTALSGPDQDSDGVPDTADACPSVNGTLGNGCQPALPPDPDGDGIYGDADKCPTQNGTGTLDGCAIAVAPPTVPAPQPIGGTVGTIKGNKLKRAALAKGVSLSIGCALDSRAAATLSVTAAVAKKLKLPIKKKQKTLTIGSASASCIAGKTGHLKVKLKRPFAKKIVRARGKIAATLSIEFTGAGATPVTVNRKLKLI